MPLYMIQVAYTLEAKAALAQVPEDRSIVFGGLEQGVGGRLDAFYNTMGEYDAVAIFEAPDEEAAHAIELGASKPGHLKETKLTPLVPVKESVRAMHEASKQEYPAPKGFARVGIMLSFGEGDKGLKARLGYGRNLLATASRIDLSVRCPSEGILLLAKV